MFIFTSAAMVSGHVQLVKVTYRYDLKHNPTAEVLRTSVQRFWGFSMQFI
jgi:hypothetical protein